MDKVIEEYNVATKVGIIEISRLRYANVDKYINMAELNEVTKKYSNEN